MLFLEIQEKFRGVCRRKEEPAGIFDVHNTIHKSLAWVIPQALLGPKLFLIVCAAFLFNFLLGNGCFIFKF